MVVFTQDHSHARKANEIGEEANNCSEKAFEQFIVWLFCLRICQPFRRLAQNCQKMIAIFIKRGINEGILAFLFIIVLVCQSLDGAAQTQV